MKRRHHWLAVCCIGLLGFMLSACMSVRPSTPALATASPPTQPAPTPTVVSRTVITNNGTLTATVAPTATQTASQAVKLNQSPAGLVIEWQRL